MKVHRYDTLPFTFSIPWTTEFLISLFLKVDVGEEAESSGGIWSSLQQVVNSFSSSESKTRPSSIMFRKLFRYNF